MSPEARQALERLGTRGAFSVFDTDYQIVSNALDDATRRAEQLREAFIQEGLILAESFEARLREVEAERDQLVAKHARQALTIHEKTEKWKHEWGARRKAEAQVKALEGYVRHAPTCHRSGLPHWTADAACVCPCTCGLAALQTPAGDPQETAEK